MVGDMVQGVFFEFDAAGKRFTRADLELPPFSEGFERGGLIFDPLGKTYYVTESRWDGSAWQTNLWIGRLER